MREGPQIAAAQILKVTNTIDIRVGEIADNMLGVDDRVTTVMDMQEYHARYIYFLFS